MPVANLQPTPAAGVVAVLLIAATSAAGAGAMDPRGRAETERARSLGAVAAPGAPGGSRSAPAHAAAEAAHRPAASEPRRAPGRLLLKLGRDAARRATLPAFGTARARLGLPALDARLASIGAHAVERLLPPAPEARRALAAEIGLDRWLVVRFPAAMDVEQARSALAAAGDAEVVEPDYQGEGAAVIPNDPSFGSQWYLRNLGNPGADIHATAAWEKTTGSASIIVAILDSGADWDHPDLDGRIWTNPGEIPGNGLDDDGNGYVDDIRGWDFVNNDNDPMDDHGHGTNVAGIAGAESNNGTGVAGVDWHCRLLIAKNLNASNAGFYSWWTASIYYAANKGARVLNMSEGGLSFSSSMEDAVNYAHGLGAIVCAAMMNANSSTPYYPANYANTVAVGATNSQDRRAVPFCWGGGSSYGSHIELVAPGDWILSTLWNNTYGYFCGTSQATPQVSAAASLVWSVAPALGNGAVRDLLLLTADDQVGDPAEDTPGFDGYYGYGRLNLERALASLVAVSDRGGETAVPPGLCIAPNPLGPVSFLRFSLPGPGRVEAELFDAGGRRVRSLASGVAAAGEGSLPVDARGLSPGLYFGRMVFTPAGGGPPHTTTQRLAVIR